MYNILLVSGVQHSNSTLYTLQNYHHNKSHDHLSEINYFRYLMLLKSCSPSMIGLFHFSSCFFFSSCSQGLSMLLYIAGFPSH